jgi:hypothetical protein
MTAGDEYRAKAAKLRVLATREKTPETRTELEKMALTYLRLAEQADWNAKVYEPPPVHTAEQPQAQQQPQTKLKPEE